ncbi:alpha/beta hydrolase [Chitinophagaceae bacterium LWZ2-11]
MSWLKPIISVLAILIIIYLLGPHPQRPKYDTTLPNVPVASNSLENFISHQESLHKVKADNEARIIWADSTKQPTEYSIVYLHGFSASQEEGNPVHRNIAGRFKCNLYLSRLAEHGLDTTDAMINLTADELWESAKQAYAIGKKLGNKVILMGTSTGGSLALQLAAAYPDVAGIILLSPNIEINNSSAWLLNNPWGLQIARLVKHSDYNNTGEKKSDYKKYWYNEYRLEGTVALEEYLETAMIPKTFQEVHQPVLTLYYYKDETHQDNVVRVDAMRKMFDELGTKKSEKRFIAIPEAGNHVLGCSIVSKDIVTPEKEITSFMEDVLDL